MKTTLISWKVTIILLLSMFSAVNADATTPWKNLFDGQTLTGWVQRNGQADYKVENGCIVGTTAPNTPNSFLCTERNYANFILELDFQIDPELNSGIQIRSQSLESYQNGRVHGYQVEIDPSDRAWTGGIYDESRRGWLNDLQYNQPARQAFKPNQWNHLRIEALGSSLKTWLNGVPAADLIDSLTPAGFIALQVHSSKSETPLSVRWRNIRIKEIDNLGIRPPANATVLLSPQTALSQWVSDSNQEAGWSFHNGIAEIIPGTGSIVTRQNVRDFYLHLEFNVNEKPDAQGQGKGNSGVYIQNRYELQILDSYGIKDYTYQDCGSIYKIQKPDVNACRPAGQWQSYDIVFRAPRWDGQTKTENALITVLQNSRLIHDGVKIPNKTGAGEEETPAGRPLKLQDHGNPLQFRNIWLVEIGDSKEDFLHQSSRVKSLTTPPGSQIKFGLVTYLWGQDWDLPTLIANCQKAGITGVELRTMHKHGVEPELSAAQREQVQKLFADSSVTLVGLGTNQDYDDPDPAQLQESIERTKQFILLSQDVGGSGVKVKPNDFHEGIPHEQTIQQIGSTLNTLAEFALPYQQQIRLEVHGQCAQLPTIKAIMDIANHPNVAVCWNSNPQDLEGEGLAANFNLIKDRLGDTVHVQQLNEGTYTYQDLINLLVQRDYDGWVLLEARGEPADPVQALIQQRQLFEKMVDQAQQELPVAEQVRNAGVKIREEGQELGVYINGKLFTRYHFRDVPRPFFYPVIGPTGEPMTRNWPMQEAPNEEQDHPHHRSLWFTHGSVNGQDFWAETDKSGNIRHDEFTRITSGPEAGVIESKNSWVAKDGKVICTDTRTHTFYNREQEIIMDYEVTIHAGQGEVVLGDTKEGSMAIRLAPTMRLKGKVAQGHIVNSEGIRDGETWGKRAEWCDYYGPIEGQVVGVAIFDHPQNPHHPTWWHVRDYGLFAANPFGIHDFENQPAGTGDLVIPANQDLKFRYRLVFHHGDEKQGNIENLYREYAEIK